MQIAVTFRHLEPDEGIKDYVKKKVIRLKKFIENPREAHVVLSVEKFRHSAELTILSDGLTLNSEGRDRDLYAAIDLMADKMDRQIREKREKTRRKRGKRVVSENMLQKPAPSDEELTEQALSSQIKRRQIPAKPMSLEEAVAQMKLRDDTTLFFINSNSGEMNALHRKKGGYEWVVPYAE